MAKQLSDFEKAFAAARKAGEKTFEWNGKKYTTQYKEEAGKPATKSAAKPAEKPADAPEGDWLTMGAKKPALKEALEKTAPTYETPAARRAGSPGMSPGHQKPEADAIEPSDFGPEDIAMLGGSAAVRKGVRAVGKAIVEGPKPYASQTKRAQEAAEASTKGFRDVSPDEINVIGEASRKSADTPAMITKRSAYESRKAESAKRAEDAKQVDRMDAEAPVSQGKTASQRTEDALDQKLMDEMRTDGGRYAKGGMIGSRGPNANANANAFDHAGMPNANANPVMPSQVPSWARPIAGSFFADGGAVGNCAPRDYGKKK